MFQADAFEMRRQDDQIGVGRIGLHLQHGLDPFVARFGMGDIDAAVEQEDFDFLGAVGKEQDVDVRMLASRAVEHGAGQVGIEGGQQAEQVERRLAQRRDQLGMIVALVEQAIGAQLGLDLGIVGKRRVLGQPQLAGGLFLGAELDGTAVLGHQAGGGAGDAGPRTGTRALPFMTGHGGLDQGRIAPILTGLCDMHIHILGICGTFMGGVAQLAVDSGHKVTGCDANVYPPMSDQLRDAGIELIQGFDIDQLALKPDIFVIGNAISRGNPLLEAILDKGLPYVSGPQWLAEHVLQGRWVLGVAGTHGKTTTSSMLAWILEDANMAPGFLIGGVPLNFGVSARLGDTPFFVIEADEYDTAFCDKRSKFVHYRPRTAVLNNLEFDHADIFSDLAAIETQFHHLVRTVPGNGLVVSNGREPSLQRVLERGCWTPVEQFGSDAGWQAGAADADGSFDVLLHGEKLGRVQWDVPGEHNRRNGLAAMLAARHAGVPLDKGLDALSRFENVKRRMEVRGVVKGITVYDDFAHHPTAMATTVAGLRRKIGNARILAVFEPRSNTMKLGTMKSQLPASLADCDHVYCYGANKNWDAAAALAPMTDRAEVHDDFDAMLKAIVSRAQVGDHILVMSNGGFQGIHNKLLEALLSSQNA